MLWEQSICAQSLVNLTLIICKCPGCETFKYCGIKSFWISGYDNPITAKCTETSVDVLSKLFKFVGVYKIL